MVGVPGRSKGCQNCRRRHVKCDLKKPQCGQCTKSQLACGGPLDLAFVVYDGAHSRDEHKPSTSNDPGTSLVKHKKEASRPGSFEAVFSLPQARDEVFTAFTRHHLLPENGHIVVPRDAGGSITTRCFQALSYTYFGVKHHDQYITQDGLAKYGRALGVLNGTLAKPQAAHSFDVLGSVTIMAIIEFLVSNHEDGWMNHARGLERLFEIRGARRMMSLPCLMILEQTRPAIIFAAIVLHKSTILASPGWKTLPWSLHPEHIDDRKKLFDILSDCPDLFVTRDRVSKFVDGSQIINAMQNLATKARSILHDLELWGQDWDSDVSHLCVELPSPSSTPTFLDPTGHEVPIWSTILQYKSVHDHNALTVYNGALILVLQFILSLDIATDQHDHAQRLQARVHEAGIVICRSVEYHYGRPSGERGSFFLLFPLRMAYDAVGKSSPAIGAWLRGKLDEIATGKRGTWKSAKTLLEIR
ncbi:hypothetical protein HBH56_096030 [Parastagonospora nodorum]|uniref:Zn(2)-C6 fungal-type domain-containing protein n=1 Tax=Phaeosphaeria nodorum (strain SN15 / ATCC MYA-4574 / FGSC 10173) TaxID=321614 RepID=Q0U754_PHANO|nr:hypothetical protein SNOG_12410 [Parastagonospora nodorum SN15]KAH3913917.1 hypothetical protein HBH56_096030 [Parastagonospora nodorum]EAT80223.1 hypothetical protein SNOG_12410 [Parastagonospora nodorum SN15]KAH3930429.1 hypothetical protein HBH54_110350 [Parastagonospora nodorum]KAH3945224.1 hypothetical protein HBH53_149090 [Parastagonospora nodorum]KAH3967026.1 hypothetical protein HBH51_140480 [Parastagonospora nodorum]